jgi:DNA adenine methylase
MNIRGGIILFEGLAKRWQGLQIQTDTKTKKFKKYPTPFGTKAGAYDAFDKLFEKHKDSILMVSYSSNAFPTMEQIIELLCKYKDKVEVNQIDHRYSFGNQGHKVDDK